VKWTEQAVRLAPRNPHIQKGYDRALLAAGRYDQLLQQLQNRPNVSGNQLETLLEQARVYAIKGDQAKLQAAITEASGLLPAPQRDEFRKQFEVGVHLLLCYAKHDVPGYLKLVSEVPELAPFPPALLRGKLQDAARTVAPDNDQAIVQHALLYLAALEARNQKLADAQFQALLADLSKGRPPLRFLGEMLSGRKPLDRDSVLHLLIDAEQKRVLLAVAAKRSQESATEFLKLARKLDFSPDPTSLCLRKVLE
jgi:hypothetical protein